MKLRGKREQLVGTLTNKCPLKITKVGVRKEMENELKLTIIVREGPNGKYVELFSEKPTGMSTAEFIGYIEMAKHDLILESTLTKEY